jgi:cell wall-associated NlpC family hydrolase
MTLMMARIGALIAIIMLVMLTACGGPPPHPGGGKVLSPKERQKVVMAASGYLGSPYKYGGTTAKGFDCSGLVYRVYKQALHRKIPRTVKSMFSGSVPIPSDKAQAGDLVFFRIYGGRIDHVGMMISNYQFIHSAKSSGVIISDFANEYYRDRFAGIRRLK